MEYITWKMLDMKISKKDLEESQLFGQMLYYFKMISHQSLIAMLAWN